MPTSASLLGAAGITVSRQWLTQQVLAVALLLAPIVTAQLAAIRACQLHGIDPYDYLVDVLQRIDSHPAKDIDQLIPRNWKDRFGEAPLRSDLHRLGA